MINEVITPLEILSLIESSNRAIEKFNKKPGNLFGLLVSYFLYLHVQI